MLKIIYSNKLLTTIVEMLIFSTILFFIATSPKLLAMETTDINQTEINLIIDDISCRGNENTDCDFIIKKYYQSIGDRLDPNQIADAKLRLGTLQQFKNIRTILEKSSQRGHVIVVFIVEEASHIQYGLGFNYQSSELRYFSGTQDVKNQFRFYGLSTSITDFNFLGSAKQLSFGLSSVKSNSSSNIKDFNIITDSSVRFESDQSSGDQQTVNLSYFDPHLLDSVDYYLMTSLVYSQTKNTNNSYIANPEGERIYWRNSSYSSKAFNLAVGRRFASFSHLLMHFNKVKYLSDGFINNTFLSNQFDENHVWLSYGWDSRDDLLFPTKGSTFEASLHGLNESEYKAVHLSYEQNLAFSDDAIFSYNLSDTYSYRSNYDDHNKFNPFIRLALNNISVNNKISGEYSSLKYQISMPFRDLSAKNIGLALTYTKQTNNLILQFSLDYKMDWSDLL